MALGIEIAIRKIEKRRAKGWVLEVPRIVHVFGLKETGEPRAGPIKK